MYDLKAFVFAVPSDPRLSPYIADRKFGPKRKMTPTTNTSTSAVAAMFREHNHPDHPAYLIVYHNVFSKVPLSPDALAAIGVQQLTLETAIKEKFQQ